MSLDVSLTCPCCKCHVFDANITHNLGTMASEAGIYKVLWRPEELFDKPQAEDISYLVERGLEMMKKHPDKYKQHDADNGWGTYEQFIPWIEKYLEALEQYPNSLITTSR